MIQKNKRLGENPKKRAHAKFGHRQCRSVEYFEADVYLMNCSSSIASVRKIVANPPGVNQLKIPSPRGARWPP